MCHKDILWIARWCIEMLQHYALWKKRSSRGLAKRCELNTYGKTWHTTQSRREENQVGVFFAKCLSSCKILASREEKSSGKLYWKPSHQIRLWSSSNWGGQEHAAAAANGAQQQVLKGNCRLKLEEMTVEVLLPIFYYRSDHLESFPWHTNGWDTIKNGNYVKSKYWWPLKMTHPNNNGWGRKDERWDCRRQLHPFDDSEQSQAE